MNKTKVNKSVVPSSLWQLTTIIRALSLRRELKHLAVYYRTVTPASFTDIPHNANENYDSRAEKMTVW